MLFFLTLGPPPSYHDSQSGFQTGQAVGGYPQQGVGGYQPQGAGGFRQQGAGGYLQQGAGGYPHGAGYPKGAGYPQGAGHPAGEYPPGPYGQPGYTQPGYGQAYMQQSTQVVIVHQPGAAVHVIVQPRPPNYTVTSILTCIFCFWRTGLCAIYCATQANRLAAEGDMAGAPRMSNKTRKLIGFVITSIVIATICITLVIVLRLVVYNREINY